MASTSHGRRRMKGARENVCLKSRVVIFEFSDGLGVSLSSRLLISTIRAQVTYITQTTPELQRQPSPPKFTYVTEPPPQPVYVKRVQSPRRPTVVYATNQPPPMRPQPRTVYVQEPQPPPQRTVVVPPPQRTVVVPPPPPTQVVQEPDPRFSYIPADRRGNYNPNTVHSFIHSFTCGNAGPGLTILVHISSGFKNNIYTCIQYVATEYI
jgi:hypothetical protein